jgi:hypothetical protein
MEKKVGQVDVERQARTKFIGLSVPVGFAEKVRAAAKQEGLSLSNFHRKALVAYIYWKGSVER